MKEIIRIKQKMNKMKKLVLLFAVLACSLASYAQFEKGTWIVNPSITSLGFSVSKAQKAQFGINAQGGLFLTDGVALLINAGADWSRPQDLYNVGATARYYSQKIGIFGGVSLDMERIRFKGGDFRNDWGVGLEAGYAFFVNRFITLEPALYYKMRFNDFDFSRFGIRLGMGFYF